MDILPINVTNVVIVALKILLLLTAAIIAAISYFHTREAHKMENKLQVALPGSVQLVMSVQLVFSVVFLFVATLIFLLF